MKYTKYLAILAAAFMMGSCSDDFLDKEPSENASEDQIKDLLDKDPTAIQAYITGYYKNMFSPEAQQSHDDFGLKAFELATDLMGDDMAYMTSHFFVYDYLLDNRASSYRRTTTYWQELYAVISGANEVISGLKEQADSGSIHIGKTISISYLPQDNREYFENCTLSIVDWLRQFSKDQNETYIRSWLGRMLFTGEENLKPVNVLSGGERVRCMFAKMMLKGANVIIMDEPTNHLDLESITSLNTGMQNFKGPLLFTSHDQEIIETVANRIIDIKSEDEIVYFNGTYEEYMQKQK